MFVAVAQPVGCTVRDERMQTPRPSDDRLSTCEEESSAIVSRPKLRFVASARNDRAQALVSKPRYSSL